MRAGRRVAAAIILLAVLIGLGAFGVVYSGAYDVAATAQHTQPIYWLLHEAAIRSIASRAAGIAVPNLSDPAAIARGGALFQQNCVPCHGAPGIPPAEFAKAMEPEPPPLIQVARDWEPADIYWTIEHGIKMTGMPAWEYRVNREDAWAIVAFLKKLTQMSPREYEATVARNAGVPPATKPPEGEDRAAMPSETERGKLALRQYSCDSCHEIPGISAFGAHPAPPLTGIAARRFIAGVLANTPDNLARWIRHPQEITPATAMPDMGVTEEHAREMVAYLETLR